MPRFVNKSFANPVFFLPTTRLSSHSQFFFQFVDCMIRIRCAAFHWPTRNIAFMISRGVMNCEPKYVTCVCIYFLLPIDIIYTLYILLYILLHYYAYLTTSYFLCFLLSYTAHCLSIYMLKYVCIHIGSCSRSTPLSHHLVSGHCAAILVCYIMNTSGSKKIILWSLDHLLLQSSNFWNIIFWISFPGSPPTK